MRIDVPLVGSSRPGRVGRFQPQRTVNWYPEVQGEGAKAQVALYPDAGLRLHLTAGTGPWRSNFEPWRGALYGVSGRDVVCWTGNGNSTIIGQLAAGSERCVIAAGRSYIMITDGQDGYTYDGTTLAAIADADFPANDTPAKLPTHCTYLDGYFVVNAEGAYYISAVDNPTSWGALDFRSAEAYSDDILAIVSSAGDLYLLGEISTEVHTNTGGADFPFEPYGNGTVRWGVAAPYSVSESPAGVFFLAQTDSGEVQVVRMQGLQADPISDFDIEWTVSQFGTVSDAVGWVYQHAGHWFYQLTFPSAARTFVYGIRSGLWHERESRGLGRHRANGHGYLGRTHYVGDNESGNLYILDWNTYTDAGQPIRRLRRAQVMHQTAQVLTYDELYLDFDTGVGLLPDATPTSGEGYDPKVRLRYSNDGGNTWSYWLERSIGKIGEYGRRAVYHALGDARERIFEIEVLEPVPAAIIGAYAEVTPSAD